MPELHDIVDKNDNVIGQMPYKKAREEQKIIRVVHNWIINTQGRILFQFRARHKTSYPRHFDASVGGKVDAGETYDQAVKRETLEELGVETTPEYAGKFLVDIPYEYKFIQVYYSIHDGPFKGWEDEAEALEWFSWEEYDALRHRYPYLFIEQIDQTLDLARKATTNEKNYE